jgi:hypothetical protein
MIEIEVKGSRDPQALAELIASTLHGHPGASPDSSTTEAGKRVRAEQEAAEVTRPSQQEMDTVNFQTIDDDLDWTEI